MNDRADREPIDRREGLRALRWLLGLARPHRGRIAMACGALLLSGAVSLVLPAVG